MGTKEYDIEKLLNKITKLRMSRNYSARELSRRANLSEGFVGNLERGVYQDVKVSIVAKIASALGVSLRSLF